MNKEEIKELENASKEQLIASIVITIITAQYNEVLQFAEYLADRLNEEQESNKSCVLKFVSRCKLMRKLVIESDK